MSRRVLELLRSPLIRLVISVGAVALVILLLNGTVSLGQVGDTVASWDVANQIRSAAGTCGLDVSVENVAGGVRTVLKDPTHGDVVVGYVDSAMEFDTATCTASQG